jgi:hypothetical protein
MKPLIAGWRLIDQSGELGRYKLGHRRFARAGKKLDLFEIHGPFDSTLFGATNAAKSPPVDLTQWAF